jgi:raffinose/stachyose/melibiose transport system permease protein
MTDSKLLAFTRYFIVYLMLAIYLIPLFFLFNTAMKTQTEYIISPVAIAKGLELVNFKEAWKIGSFSTFIKNSLLYTVSSTFFSIILALLAAYPIARRYVKFSDFYYILFIMSLFLPSALIPQFVLINWLGLYNTEIGYIILRTSGTGIAFLMFVGYIKSISRELDEAASIDGSGYIRFLFSILIPLIKPVLATGIMLTAIGTWNDIIGPIIYLSDASKQPITRGLFAFYGQYANNWPLLACGILIVALPLILLYMYVQRFLVSGALAGSVKL